MSLDHPYELPRMLAEIAEITSLGTALKVAMAKGGQAAYIPSKFRDEHHWLPQAVGMEDAKIIADYFAGNGKGETHQIPMASAGLRQRTWAQIQKMIDDGESADKIAAATGVHRRTVFRHKKTVPDFPLLAILDSADE